MSRIAMHNNAQHQYDEKSLGKWRFKKKKRKKVIK